MEFFSPRWRIGSISERGHCFQQMERTRRDGGRQESGKGKDVDPN